MTVAIRLAVVKINTYYLMYGRVYATGNITKELIAHEGRSPEGLRDISRSVDTTHTLNDLLLGKPEDERSFYIRRLRETKVCQGSY